jgi:hypothetical protein
MLKRITSEEDIQNIKVGDTIYDYDKIILAQKYEVYLKINGNIVVTINSRLFQTRRLTKEELMSGNWWVKE